MIRKPAIHIEPEEAFSEARRPAGLRGQAFCVISRFSPGRGRTVYRVFPLEGFGLPAGWAFEDTVEPLVEKTEKEPPEKTSTNGF
jgi:hypothetical protein